MTAEIVGLFSKRGIDTWGSLPSNLP